jgi:hypothetical protein
MQEIFYESLALPSKIQNAESETIVPELERLFTERDRSQKSTICSQK